MNTLLNIIWLVLSGVWLFLGYVLAGVVMCILIVTIPWGIASFRIAGYALWPFGRTVVQKPTSGAWSFIGNVIWVILAGWWLALEHLIAGVLLCVTIIGSRSASRTSSWCRCRSRRSARRSSTPDGTQPPESRARCSTCGR